MQATVILLSICLVNPVFSEARKHGSATGLLNLPTNKLMLVFGLSSLKMAVAGRMKTLLGHLIVNGRGRTGLTTKHIIRDVNDKPEDYWRAHLETNSWRSTQESDEIPRQQKRKNSKRRPSDLPRFRNRANGTRGRGKNRRIKLDKNIPRASDLLANQNKSSDPLAKHQESITPPSNASNANSTTSVQSTALSEEALPPNTSEKNPDTSIKSNATEKNSDTSIRSNERQENLDNSLKSTEREENLDISLKSNATQENLVVPLKSNATQEDLDIPLTLNATHENPDTPTTSDASPKTPDISIKLNTAQENPDNSVEPNATRKNPDVPMNSNVTQENFDIPTKTNATQKNPDNSTSANAMKLNSHSPISSKTARKKRRFPKKISVLKNNLGFETLIPAASDASRKNLTLRMRSKPSQENLELWKQFKASATGKSRAFRMKPNASRRGAQLAIKFNEFQRPRAFRMKSNASRDNPRLLKNWDVLRKTPNISMGGTVEQDAVRQTASERSNFFLDEETKTTTPVHRIVKRQVTATPTNDSATLTSSGEIFLSKRDMENFFSQTRTLGQPHCYLKMVCYLGGEQEAKHATYGGQIASVFSGAWERHHPKFLDRLFGYDESLVIGRSNIHDGCILKYNSCPMSIVNMIYLSMNLQRSDTAEADSSSVIP